MYLILSNAQSGMEYEVLISQPQSVTLEQLAWKVFGTEEDLAADFYSRQEKALLEGKETIGRLPVADGDEICAVFHE